MKYTDTKVDPEGSEHCCFKILPVDADDCMSMGSSSEHSGQQSSGVIQVPLSSIHNRAFLIALAHYLLSIVIACAAFALAFGSGLSDTNHGDAGAGTLGVLLVVLHAPVAVVQWLVVHASADGKTGLQIPGLFLIAVPSSLIYGYAIALVFGSFGKRLKAEV